METISKTSLNLRFVAEGLVCHARSFLGSIEASMKLGLAVQASGNLSCARQSFVYVAPRDVQPALKTSVICNELHLPGLSGSFECRIFSESQTVSIIF